MMLKQNQYEDDDGRVICDMNVPGMPWYDRSVRREKRAARVSGFSSAVQMTKSEIRRFTWNAILAGLMIAGVYAAVWALFILFATKIWLR